MIAGLHLEAMLQAFDNLDKIQLVLSCQHRRNLFQLLQEFLIYAAKGFRGRHILLHDGSLQGSHSLVRFMQNLTMTNTSNWVCQAGT